MSTGDIRLEVNPTCQPPLTIFIYRYQKLNIIINVISTVVNLCFGTRLARSNENEAGFYIEIQVKHKSTNGFCPLINQKYQNVLGYY